MEGAEELCSTCERSWPNLSDEGDCVFVLVAVKEMMSGNDRDIYRG